MLVNRYNVDRMGPYDIAQERQASQLRLYAIFFLLLHGIYSFRDREYDTFGGEKINYGVIYNILLGLLEDAAGRSTANHQKSKCFSCLKRKTKSHYAVMLQRLIADEKEKNTDSLEMYTEVCENSLLFKHTIIYAETLVDFVEDETKASGPVSQFN